MKLGQSAVSIIAKILTHIYKATMQCKVKATSSIMKACEKHEIGLKATILYNIFIT